MSVRSFLVRLTVKAVVAVLAWSGASASAADVTVPPVPVVSAAPVSVGDPGCATCQKGAEGCESCQHGAIRAKCNVCGKLLGSHLKKDKKAPFPVTLCPGSCFGYFQTQWRKWDEVCPYPYTGVGVNDAPRSGSGLAAPRPLDPKVMPEPKKSDLPPIPTPGNKFGP